MCWYLQPVSVSDFCSALSVVVDLGFLCAFRNGGRRGLSPPSPCAYLYGTVSSDGPAGDGCAELPGERKGQRRSVAHLSPLLTIGFPHVSRVGCSQLECVLVLFCFYSPPWLAVPFSPHLPSSPNQEFSRTAVARWWFCASFFSGPAASLSSFPRSCLKKTSVGVVARFSVCVTGISL